MKNLGKKILSVMDEVQSVEKDGFNAFHKYKYTSDAAIVSAIRQSLIKNGLVVLPSQIACSQTGDLTSLTVNYHVVDTESGESFDSAVVGYGQDKGDKGVYKAATGAEKYFLLKTFLIPTDDDPEKENGKPRPAAQSNETKAIRVSSKTAPTSIQNVFEVPQELKTKQGSSFWKTKDGEGASYFIFDKVISDFMKLHAGEQMQADVETTEKGSRIVGFREIPK